MKPWTLIILGVLLLVPGLGPHGLRLAPASANAAAPALCGPATGTHGPVDASSWPSYNADATQSNYNPNAAAITAKNILKVKARWCALTAAASYPIVADGRVFLPIQGGGKVHARALDAATGRQVMGYPKDALGGMLAANGKLYLAGHILQAVDEGTGQSLFTLAGSPRLAGNTFLFPQTDGHYLFSGFYSGINSSIYSVDPDTGTVVQKVPSTTACDTIASGRILTATGTASIFYDAASGRVLAHPPYRGSFWFAGSTLNYTVASAKKKGTMLVALDGTGRRVWNLSVGPLLATVNTDWPHAVGPTMVYVQTFRPQEGIEAVDALTGQVLWARPLANVQRLALTKKLLVALTYGLGQPGRLIAINPKTGKLIGGITLSPGFFPFGSANGLMIANGMIYIRVTGPGNVAELVALGL
jgi:PQQ-like domain